MLIPAGEAVPVLTVVGLVTKTPDEDLSTYDMQSADPTAAPAKEEAESQVLGPVGTLEGQEEDRQPSRIFASPRARRRAREEGVALEEVTGTGPRGRIVEQDILDHLAARPQATPVAQRLASHAGIDLGDIAGSGPGGRITKADVEQTIDVRESPPRPEPSSSPGTLRDVPMRGIRARIAQRMHTSHQETAPVFSDR